MLKSELKPLAPPKQKLTIDPALAAAAGGVVGVGVAYATNLVSQWAWERYTARKRKRNGNKRIQPGRFGDVFEVTEFEEVVITRRKQIRVVMKGKL
jgi:hypothetical protein